MGCDGGYWNLELDGWLGGSDWRGRHREDTPDQIRGRVGSHMVTLESLAPGSYSAVGEDRPYNSAYSANRVFAGHRWIEREESWTGLSLRALYLNEWADRRPLRRPGLDAVEYVGEPMHTASTDLFDVSLRCILSHRTMGHYAEEWRCEECLVFSDLSVPMSVDGLEERLIRPAVNMLSLASGRNSESEIVHLFGADPDEHPVQLLLPCRPTAEPLISYLFMFNLADIDFADYMKLWFAQYTRFGHAVNLSMGISESQGYVSDKLLLGAAAVEELYRAAIDSSNETADHRRRVKRIVSRVDEADRAWLRAKLVGTHRPSFDEMLTAVLDSAGPAFQEVLGSRNEWCARIKSDRHKAAHGNPFMPTATTDWLVTARATEALELMLRIVLLAQTGFSPEHSAARLSRSFALRSLRENLMQCCPEWFAT